ncbi:MAG: M1 family aminopeptidase [Candidatus Sumerlaeota bacterium]|nr:M1 family aminopeptidase [Candidatus Sumerlaeota bacterium]
MKKMTFILIAAALLILAAGAGIFIYLASQPRTAPERLQAAVKTEEDLNKKILLLAASKVPDAAQKTGALEDKIAKKYQAVIERHPSTPEAEEAAYRLMRRRLDTLGDAKQRRETIRTFLKEHPNSPHAADLEWEVAELLDKDPNQRLETIKAYTEFADRFSSDTRAGDALLRVARVYDEIKEFGAAAQAYEKFIHQCPKHPRVEDAQLRLAEIYEEKLKQKEKAKEAYDKLRQGDKKDGETAGGVKGRTGGGGGGAAAVGRARGGQMDAEEAEAERREYRRKYYVVPEISPYDAAFRESENPLFKRLSEQGLHPSHYEIELVILPEWNEMRCSVTVQLSVSRRIENQFIMMLNEDLNISSLAVGARPQFLTSRREGPLLVAALPQDMTVINPGASVRLQMIYDGTCEDTWSMDRITSAGAYLRVESLWLPLFGFDSAMTADLRVTVPDTMTAFGPGVQQGAPTKVAGGLTKAATHHWQSALPVLGICTAAANYQVRTQILEGIPVTVALFPRHSRYAGAYFKEIQGALKFFISKFGAFAYPSLTIAEIQDFPGGYGSPGLVMIGSDFFSASDGATTAPAEFLAHEIAHQWFGNKLRVDLSERSIPWLSEGFATYADALYVEHRDGPAALRRHLMNYSLFYYKGLLAFRDWPLLKVRHQNEMYRPITYEKGAWTLHTLRWVMGDEKFFAALRDYCDANTHKFVTVDTFREACEKHSDQSLKVFFEQWFEREGMPSYSIAAAFSDRATSAAQPVEAASGAPFGSNTPKEYPLTVTVTQKEPFFDLPVELTFDFADGTQTLRRTHVSDEVTTLTFALPRPPVTVTLDKDNWILKHPNQKELTATFRPAP